MRSVGLLAFSLAFGLVGCIEYEFGDDSLINGEPNPPNLATPVITDRIVQTTVPAVDVLWVIDNSCSMSEEQAALATNFPRFMNFFADSGLDYHVGVVSTDMSDFNQRGKLLRDPSTGLKVIDSTVQNPVPVFQGMATLGTNGDADEKGRAAAYTALVTRGSTDNAGFFRSDAFLSIIVVSDENDYSGDFPVSLPNFIDWLQTVKPTPDMVSFSSIVTPPTGCPGASSYDIGTEYLQVTQAVGGVEWPICQSDWDQALEELGLRAAGLRREFFLTEVPVADSLAVWIEDDGQRTDYHQGVDYTYNRQRNSVLFANLIPDPLSEVFIEYQVLAALADEEVAE